MYVTQEIEDNMCVGICNDHYCKFPKSILCILSGEDVSVTNHLNQTRCCDFLYHARLMIWRMSMTTTESVSTELVMMMMIVRYTRFLEMW